MTPKDVARFWKKVAKRGISDCWLWTAGKQPAGYGQFHVGGRVGGRPHGAHRIAWTHAFGPIPEGMHVCHRCDVPACVNPAHLFLGTHGDNMRDKVSKGRQAKGAAFDARKALMSRGAGHYAKTRPERLARGERSGKSSLTALDVAEIRRLRDAGATYASLGRRFEVSAQAVRAIALRLVWTHV
jgi:hypothetical protein